MDKDPICGIKRQLSDIPSGKCLMIRHPLSGEDLLSD